MKTERPEHLGGRYDVNGEIARVGTTTVYRGTDRVLGRPVAVKVLRAVEATDPQAAERFLGAARATAALNHPGIVRVLDTGLDRGNHFVVTELAEGRPLHEVLAAEGPMEPGRAAALVASVLDVLQAAHLAGVVHGDLGPSSVFVSAGGVKVADFGVGEGTAAQDVSRSGTLLFQALVGGTEMSRRSDRPRFPRAFQSVLARARGAGGEGGFGSAGEFRLALEGLAGTRRRPSADEETGSVEEDDEGSFFRRWMLVPLLLVLVVSALIGGGLALGRLELGGPLGVQTAEQDDRGPSPLLAAKPLPVRVVTAFDPFGTGGENDQDAGLAADGEGETSWQSENYFDGSLNKPGVGLLFDLGTDQSVTGFRLATPNPGSTFEVRVGEDPDALAVESSTAFTAEEEVRVDVDRVRGRFVLLWCTSVVPAEDGSNRVVVGEFEVFGRGA